jgi:predicted nucleotidyltransferase
MWNTRIFIAAMMFYAYQTIIEGRRPLMKPSVILEMKRNSVREMVARYRTANPRIFGSVLHGTDHDGSDLDILVDALPGATLLDLGDLQEELRVLLGVDVDLLTPGDLPPKIRSQILSEAQPV